MISKKFTNIKNLLTMPEGRTFDRKAAEYDRKKLANILVAYANADGGVVAIGIKNKKIEGINCLGPHKINALLQVGVDLVNPSLKVDPTFLPVTVKGEKNKILLLAVSPSSDIIYANKRDEIYLRVGDDTKKLSYKQVRSLEFDKGIRYYEQEVVKGALLKDLDPEVVDEYKKIYGFKGKNLWDLLFPKGLAKRIIKNNTVVGYNLTVAGVLLLAKNPDIFIPDARIRFIRYNGTKSGTDEDLDVIKQEIIEGPLTKQIQKAKDIVESQLRNFTNLDLKTGRFQTVPEYPNDTWLEGIVNAVTHRSYNLHGDDIRIIMYNDRIVIHSPGNLPSIVTVDNIRHTHYSKNPYIASALVEFGWVREFGEGVNRMYERMEEYFLEDPEYKANDSFTELTLRNNIVMRNMRMNQSIRDILRDKWTNLSKNERRTVIYIYENKKVRAKDFIKDVPTIKESTARGILSRLVKKGILKRHASSTHDPKGYYTLNKEK